MAEVAGAAAVALVVVLAASYAGYRHKSISVWQVGFAEALSDDRPPKCHRGREHRRVI